MKKISQISLLAVLTLATVFFYGCERETADSVDQDKIYTEYELYYNQNEDKTYARATFKFSNALGTKLELVDNAEVAFNGDILAWQPALAYYEKSYAGLVETGNFIYTDLNGTTFQNDVRIEPIAYPLAFDTIARDSALELVWGGSPLADGDDVTLVINGVLEGDAQTFYTNDLGATSIILAKNKLEQLGNGGSTIWMDRRAYPGLAEGTSAGGYIVGRYRPTNATPYLK